LCSPYTSTPHSEVDAEAGTAEVLVTDELGALLLHAGPVNGTALSLAFWDWDC
jgi:hypothetical protein